MFYTYILKSVKVGNYYVGCTSNIEARIDKHNNGYVRSTKPINLGLWFTKKSLQHYAMQDIEKIKSKAGRVEKLLKS